MDQFDLLRDEEKEDYLWKNGTFISNLLKGNNIWDTYELEDYYVSVCFNLTQNEDTFYVAYSTNALHFLKPITD